MRPLVLGDGMHPNRQGVELMVRKILPAVTAFLKSVSG